ncbi:MAG: hypothetical protein ACFFDW_04445 [Candidatus Thorarchaeota archaeon]
MSKEIFTHIAILTAHIAQNIIEKEGIHDFCISPCDLAVICHEKHYIQKEIIGKMMTHISDYEYLERRGEVYILADAWRRMLPAKIDSEKILREQGLINLYHFQELISKHFLEIARNDSQKITLNELIYYLDSIDGSKGLQNIRSEVISNLNIPESPKRIFDFNFGLGYSTNQLANIYEYCEIFSFNLINSLKDACEYTLARYNKSNVIFSKNYPSEMLNNVMKEKVDRIFMFNPLGLELKEFEKYLNIAQQISCEGTKLIITIPFLDQPKNVLISEWLGNCIEGMGQYMSSDYYRVILPKYKFEINKLDTTTNTLIATRHHDL